MPGVDGFEFAENVRKALKSVGEEDELILFADIVGGSPLATAANVIAESGLLERTKMIGGMNLPLVLSTVLSKDMTDDMSSELANVLIPEGREAIKEFFVEAEDDADEI